MLNFLFLSEKKNHILIRGFLVCLDKTIKKRIEKIVLFLDLRVFPLVYF